MNYEYKFKIHGQADMDCLMETMCDLDVYGIMAWQNREVGGFVVHFRTPICLERMRDLIKLTPDSDHILESLELLNGPVQHTEYTH